MQKKNQALSDFHGCGFDFFAASEHPAIDHFEAEHVPVKSNRPIEIRDPNCYMIQKRHRFISLSAHLSAVKNQFSRRICHLERQSV
jgi:hypothetical protein